jgi:hypothetical protein
MKPKPKDISFHYTNEQMVKDLIALTPFEKGDIVLDAGSGKNKVWYKNIPDKCIRYECEIEDGEDFLTYNKKYDWIIGNPPYNCSWSFTDKATQLSQKGVAWLLNNQCLQSQLTPRRLSILEERGFYIKHLRVVADKRWFGRYYFLIFTKQPNNFLSWERKTY